jgi:hypothetical protein
VAHKQAGDDMQGRSIALRPVLSRVVLTARYMSYDSATAVYAQDVCCRATPTGTLHLPRPQGGCSCRGFAIRDGGCCLRFVTAVVWIRGFQLPSISRPYFTRGGYEAFVPILNSACGRDATRLHPHVPMVSFTGRVPGCCDPGMILA